MTSNNEHFVNSIQQDTLNLVKPQSQGPTLRMPTSIARPQVDLERAQEVITQTEQREQQIVAQRNRVIIPRTEELRQPSIDIDPLMAQYHHMGCVQAISFPDTISLTILEHYYQPIITIDSSYTASSFTETGTIDPGDSQFELTTQLIPVETTALEKGLSAESRTESYPSTVTLFLLGSLILFTWIKFHFGRSIVLAFQSFFNYQQACRAFDERRESDKQAAIYTNILAYICAGTFITLVLPFFGGVALWNSYSLSILFFTLCVAIIFAIKAMVWKTFGIIFLAESFSQEYVYNMYLYNRNAGTFILPAVIAIPFVPYEIVPVLIYAVIAIICVSYLAKMFRNFQIIRARNVSALYFILYLCTLEILPLLLFVKACKVLSAFLFA